MMQINQLESSVHQMNGGRARTIGSLQARSFNSFRHACCRASRSPNAQGPAVQAISDINALLLLSFDLPLLCLGLPCCFHLSLAIFPTSLKRYSNM